MRTLTIRFDVDTHVCIRDGVPALSELGQRLGVPFTFFANMGRAVPPLTRLRGVMGGRHPGEGTPRLSARAKLGVSGWLRAALENPPLRRWGAALASARACGHEIGLHGGRNHALWQAEADRWDRPRLLEEVAWGRRELEKFVPADVIQGFASPGWNGNKQLGEVLAELGFAYLADDHAAAPAPVSNRKAAVIEVGPTLAGGGDGVAWIEHLRAIGQDDAEVLASFRSLLDREQSFAIYEHPYFAMTELPLLERMVFAAQEHGFRLVTLGDVACSE